MSKDSTGPGSAIESWGGNDGQHGDGEGASELGGNSHHDHDGEGAHGVDEEFAPAGDPQDDAHAAKKAKDVRTMKIAGGVALVLIAGVVGLKFANPSQGGQQLQQPMPEQQVQMQPQQVAEPAPQPASDVIAPVVGQDVNANFGLAAPVVGANEQVLAAEQTLPGAQPVPAPVATESQSSAQPAFPAPQGKPAVPPAVIHAPAPQQPFAQAPTVAPQPAPVALAPSPAAAHDNRAVEELRREFADLKSVVNSKNAEIASLKDSVAKLRSQIGVPRPAAAPVKSAAKPSELPVAPAGQKSTEQPATAGAALPALAATAQALVPVASPQALAKRDSKVRSDYRIYAMVDGRAWVLGPDKEPLQIAVRSPLPDGSRVVSIDVDKNVVHTTAGEIHHR